MSEKDKCETDEPCEGCGMHCCVCKPAQAAQGRELFSRNNFEELIQDDWFVDNPNGTDIREELNAMISAYDAVVRERDMLTLAADKAIKWREDLIKSLESTEAYLLAQVALLEKELAEVMEANSNCISLLLHENRMDAANEENIKLKFKCEDLQVVVKALTYERDQARAQHEYPPFKNLQAERDKYKAALERIATMAFDAGDKTQMLLAADTLNEIAHEALGETKCQITD